MNTILTFTESLINDAYSFAQWYSRTGHDQLMEILHCFGTVLFMLWNDLTEWGATTFIATYNWLIDTFNSCDTNYVVCPLLSMEQGYITYPVIASDLISDWRFVWTPVKESVSRMTAAIGIAVTVVKELL